MRQIIILVPAVIVSLVAAAAVAGSLLPKGHEVSLTLDLNRSPDEVWRVITDYTAMTAWRKNLKSIERQSDRNGHAVWKEVTQDGWELPLEDQEVNPPRRLVRRIADPNLPFSGTWTYEIEASEAGSRLRITERGEVSNPFFRLMGRFMDQSASIHDFLTALSAKFGEPARIG